MQTLPIIKNRLIKLYCFAITYIQNCLPYHSIVVKAFVTGNRKVLYLLGLIFPLNKLTSRLFLIFASPLNVFTYLLRGPSTLFMSARFWVLILHHFIVFYEVILSLRFVMEWYPSINLNEGGIFEQIILNVSEPYFKACEEILPKGLSAIFAWLLIEQIKSFISRFYRLLTTYFLDTNSTMCLETMDILALTVFGEKIIPG